MALLLPTCGICGGDQVVGFALRSGGIADPMGVAVNMRRRNALDFATPQSDLTCAHGRKRWRSKAYVNRVVRVRAAH